MMTIREKILSIAKTAVTKDRNESYGDPEDNLGDTAALWSGYLKMVIEPHDVAALMVLLKVARIRRSPEEFDHWVDIAGWSACGAECGAECAEVIVEAVFPNTIDHTTKVGA